MNEKFYGVESKKYLLCEYFILKFNTKMKHTVNKFTNEIAYDCR